MANLLTPLSVDSKCSLHSFATHHHWNSSCFVVVVVLTQVWIYQSGESYFAADSTNRVKN